MAKIKVKMNERGCCEIRNSKNVQYVALFHAKKICKRANYIGKGKYEADVRPGKTRCHAMVKTADGLSAVSNARSNVLLKALGG